MTRELTILLATAASIGFVHTILGPDHYVPFIVMAKAGKWSNAKTMFTTFLCGVGHVGSSVVLGLLGIALGLALHKLEFIESFRGNVAAWALISFGLVYFAWGVQRAVRNKPHTHIHPHADGSLHTHEHTHTNEHAHVHSSASEHAHGHSSSISLTPWVLFTIFVLGPCEPLIPLLMYPAANNNMVQVFMVSGLFGIVTVVTMMSVVYLSILGLKLVPEKGAERYIHAIAGGAILLSGLAIQFLGL